MKQKVILFLLFLGFVASTSTKAQTYLHLEETSGTDNTFLIADVGVITFTATDLNLKETDGTVNAFVMDDIQKIIFNNVPPLVGISEINSATSGVYPNPTNGVFTLNISNVNASEFSVSVYDVTGSLLSTITYTQKGSVLNEKIDLSEYGKGIYFLKINSDNNIITKKIIVN